MDTPSKNKDTVILQTETEHMLARRLQEERARYSEERQERIKLESLVNDLKSQIQILQQQLKCVMETESAPPSTSNTKSSSQQVDYGTDDEELSKETEWIRTKARKKRKLNTSPSLSPPQPHKAMNEKVKKIPAPPPIIVDGVIDYQNFYDFLSTNQSAVTFKIKILSGDSVKINACNDEAYRSITKSLTENNCLWHSYENKQDRPIRVMVKKLPSTCKPDRIISDLQTKGYQIEDAVNKLSWKTKEPLNMFMLTFNNKEEINKIYEIKIILGCTVDIQPLRSPKLIPQCKRCQVYGHTHKYCAKEPRCVKCTGKHLTKDCRKPAEQKPKCVHCGEAHPANYRGCIIAKEMQKIKNKTLKKPMVNQHQQITNKTAPAVNQPKPGNSCSKGTSKNVSYAQAAAKNTTSIQRSEQTDSNECKLNEILKFMTLFDERLKKIESSTKTATPKASK